MQLLIPALGIFSGPASQLCGVPKENGNAGFSASLNWQRCRPATPTGYGIHSPWSCYSLACHSIGFPYFSDTVASALQSGTTHLGRAPDKNKSRLIRSEERRVGKECRSRWSPYH